MTLHSCVMLLLVASGCTCRQAVPAAPAEVLVSRIRPRIAAPKGEVTEATVPRFREDAAIEKVGGRWVAATEGQLHSFESADGAVSEVGERIVELIDGRRSVAQIVEVLCSEFEVPHEVAQADTLVFIKLLVERELVTFGSGSDEK